MCSIINTLLKTWEIIKDVFILTSGSFINILYFFFKIYCQVWPAEARKLELHSHVGGRGLATLRSPPCVSRELDPFDHFLTQGINVKLKDTNLTLCR